MRRLVVLDQNVLRPQGNERTVFEQARDAGAQFLLPDVSALEMSSGSEILGVWRDSMAILAGSLESVHVSANPRHAISEEIRTGEPTPSLVCAESTSQLRSFLGLAFDGEQQHAEQIETVLRNLRDGVEAEMARPWIERIQQVHITATKRIHETVPKEHRRLIADGDVSAFSEVLRSTNALSSAVEFLVHSGLSEESSLSLIERRSAASTWFYVVLAFAIHAASTGGAAEQKPRKFRNSVYDLQYVHAALMEGVLLSHDKLANLVFSACAYSDLGRRWSPEEWSWPVRTAAGTSRP